MMRAPNAFGDEKVALWLMFREVWTSRARVPGSPRRVAKKAGAARRHWGAILGADCQNTSRLKSLRH